MSAPASLPRLRLGAVAALLLMAPLALHSHPGRPAGAGPSLARTTKLYMKAVGPSPMRWSAHQSSPGGLPRDPGMRIYNPQPSAETAPQNHASTDKETAPAPNPGIPAGQTVREQAMDTLLELLRPAQAPATPATPLRFTPPSSELPTSSAEFIQR